MNDSTIKGKWNEVKGEIRKVWGNLTGDELEKTKGDVQSITGLIEQKYGHKKDEISRKLSEITNRYAESAKSSLRESNDKDTQH